MLEPYRETIEGWTRPDVIREQNPSASTAKRAIGYREPGFLNALCGMLEQAAGAIKKLPVCYREPFLARMDNVRRRGSEIGYGVGDHLEHLFPNYDKRGA